MAGGTVTKNRAKGAVLKEQNEMRSHGNNVNNVKETIVVTCESDLYLVRDVIRAGVGECLGSRNSNFIDSPFVNICNNHLLFFL